LKNPLGTPLARQKPSLFLSALGRNASAWGEGGGGGGGEEPDQLDYLRGMVEKGIPPHLWLKDQVTSLLSLALSCSVL